MIISYWFDPVIKTEPNTEWKSFIDELESLTDKYNKMSHQRCG